MDRESIVKKAVAIDEGVLIVWTSEFWYTVGMLRCRRTGFEKVCSGGGTNGVRRI